MKMIKNNFGTVVKLWVNQAGGMLFGSFLLFPTAILIDKNESLSFLLALVSALSAIFYLLLIFWVVCELGLRDSVPIEGGRMKMQWYKGTVLALVANAPALIAAIVQSVSKAFVPGVGYFEAIAQNEGAAVNVYAISMKVNEILHIMYQGLLVKFRLTLVPFIYIPVIVISVAVCTVGYIAGTKGFLARLLAKDARRRQEM